MKHTNRLLAMKTLISARTQQNKITTYLIMCVSMYCEIGAIQRWMESCNYQISTQSTYSLGVGNRIVLSESDLFWWCSKSLLHSPVMCNAQWSRVYGILILQNFGKKYHIVANSRQFYYCKSNFFQKDYSKSACNTFLLH